MSEVNVENIEAQVKEVFADVLRLQPEEIEKITPATSFDDLNMDSLDRVELVMELEEKFEEFNVKISDEEAEKIQTFGEVIRYIKKYTEDKK